jgi:hypothetical protein
MKYAQAKSKAVVGVLASSTTMFCCKPARPTTSTVFNLLSPGKRKGAPKGIKTA